MVVCYANSPLIFHWTRQKELNEYDAAAVLQKLLSFADSVDSRLKTSTGLFIFFVVVDDHSQSHCGTADDMWPRTDKNVRNI